MAIPSGKTIPCGKLEDFRKAFGNSINEDDYMGILIIRDNPNHPNGILANFILFGVEFLHVKWELFISGQNGQNHQIPISGSSDGRKVASSTVSYTHLTLPTTPYV